MLNRLIYIRHLSHQKQKCQLNHKILIMLLILKIQMVQQTRLLNSQCLLLSLLTEHKPYQIQFLNSNQDHKQQKIPHSKRQWL